MRRAAVLREVPRTRCHTSTSSGKWNFGAITPTTMYGVSLNDSGLPMIDGSALKRVRHSRSLITQINSLVTNIGPPAGKPAPTCGFTPSTSNRLPPTSIVVTRIGSLPGSVRLMPGRHHAAASLNTGSAR